MTKRIGKDNIILPIGDGEGTFEDRLYSLRTDDELLMIHKMLVTNKFVPLSTVKSIIIDK